MRGFLSPNRLFSVLTVLLISVALLPPTPAVLTVVQPGRLVQFPLVSSVASYRIQVTLDVITKTLDAQQTITYTNTTQAAIPDLIFHLYLNAFRDRNSLFLRESADYSRGYAWDPQFPGWIRVTGIRLAGGPALPFEEIEDGTLGRALLPDPIAPGETAVIEMDFTAQLPRVFARTGFAGNFFMVGQWFPKLGVWQHGTWNAYPFHANAEFFADFGAYEVEITLPAEYVTGGVGLPIARIEHSNGTQTVTYHAEGVIDFAWTASPYFRPVSRQMDGVEIVYLCLPEHAWSVELVLDAAEAALRNYSQWYGPYAYPRLTVVDVPDEGQGAGGMEYPTLITAGTTDFLSLGPNMQRLGFDRFLELVIMHEVGHQWWQSMVAFNEAEEPWLDEGLADYSTARLAGSRWGVANSAIDAWNLELGYLDLRRMEYLLNPALPMYGRAWDFDGLSEYGIAAYSKPVLSLSSLEGVLGEAKMLEILSEFFQRYRFTHPTTADFQAVVEEKAGQDLAWFFDGLVYGAEVLNFLMAAVEPDSVSVVRQGGLQVPVDVLVTFADGSRVTEAWDGKESRVTFTYPDRPAVVSAVVDPQRKLLIDQRWSDNGLSRQRDLNAWLALISRFVYRLQDIVLIWGGW